MAHPITSKMIAVESSNAHSVCFCPDCSSFYLRYLRGDKPDDTLYKFKAGPDENAALQKVIAEKGSVGSWLHANLTGKHLKREFTKLKA